MEYDFVSIGDIVTDAFIRLLDDSAEIVGDGEKLCVAYQDKIPFERSYVIPGVGNSANAAVSASRLGLSAALVSNVGDDRAGGEMVEKLHTEGVDTKFVHINKNKMSNYHYVLWYKDDRTILIKHEEYEYHLPAIGDPKWIYFSSVGEHALPFHEEVAEYARLRSNTNLAFQPGTFQIKLGAQKLKNIYKESALFFCNREEAALILETDSNEIATLMKGINALGPKIVVITDGKDGAYALEGETIWFMSNYPDPKPPLERTGAGDSFSSAFTSALALGMSVADALRWAPINSMSVVQYVGAQEGLLRRSQLERYLASAPANYKAVKWGTI